MSKLTIYDISELAGVSITTVSRVLNGKTNVSLETKNKVEDIIKRYDYVPKRGARQFKKTKDVKIIGLLMEDIRHAYLSEVAYSINQELSKWKVNTILCNISDVEREFITQIDNLSNNHVSGIILLGSIFEKDICKMTLDKRYSDIPFVTVNANFNLPNVSEIIQDQENGVKDSIKYLYEKGRRNIGLIFYKKSRSDQSKYKGFISGIEKLKLESYRQGEVIEMTLEAGKKATAELLDKYPDTDAIVYTGDVLAVGGVHYLSENNYNIPNDISLVGFNNSSISKQCYPQLTSIDNNISKCGTFAAKSMINILNNQTADNIVIDCTLKIRQST